MTSLTSDQRARILAIRSARLARVSSESSPGGNAVSAGELSNVPMGTFTSPTSDQPARVGIELPNLRANLAMMAAGYRPELDNAGHVVVWRSESGEDSDATDARRTRSRASRAGRRTEHARNVAAIRSDQPASVGRPFDGTMARVRDGGMAQNYDAGISATYGKRVTERTRETERTDGRTFTVRLLVWFCKGDPPYVAREYVDDIATDRTDARKRAERTFALAIDSFKGDVTRIDIAESEPEPVRIPATAGAVNVPMGTLERTAGTVRTVTSDPYAGSYADWRRLVVATLNSIARELAPSALAGAMVGTCMPYSRPKLAKILVDYRKWAEREGWSAAAGIVADAIAALLDDTLTSAGLAHSFGQADQRIPNVP